MFNFALSSIKNMVQNTMNNLNSWIENFFETSSDASSSKLQNTINLETTSSSNGDFGKALALYAIFAGIISLIMAFLYLSEIVEIAAKVLLAIFSGGAGNAAAEAFVTLVKPAIISAVIGATFSSLVGSVGNILIPDEETLSEPFSEAGDLVSGLASIFAILFIVMEWRLTEDSKDKIGSAKRGIAMELVGLMILIFGPDKGFFRLVFDAIGLGFVLFGAFTFVKDYKKNPLSNIAGYTTLLETIITGVSVIGSFAEIAEHAVNGKWHIY